MPPNNLIYEDYISERLECLPHLLVLHVVHGASSKEGGKVVGNFSEIIELNFTTKNHCDLFRLSRFS